MFWDIVGAILFVFVGIPVIIYVAILILGVGLSLLENKAVRQGCGYGCLFIIGAIVLLGIIIYGNNKNASESFQRKENNKYALLQNIRTANPNSFGYILLQDMGNETWSLVKTTDGKFYIYRNMSECYDAEYQMYQRFGYNYSYSCELL